MTISKSRSTPASSEETVSKSCRICGKDMPCAATFCTECEHWQEAPGLIRAKQLSRAVLAIAASLGIPLFVYCATRSYEKVQTAQARADVATQRESQVLEALGSALQATIAISQQFRAGAAKLEAACSPGTMPENASEPNVLDCSDRFLQALGILDEVVIKVSWAIDTVPVKQDTYARTSNLKYHYFRGCPDDGPSTPCGFRQRVLRYLHGRGEDGQIALKRCAKVDGAEIRTQCSRALESMKQTTIASMRGHINDVLCSVTRDANELRMTTWRKMQADASLAYDDLAARLRAITDHSDCARRLKQNPIPADCPFGMDMAGRCLE